SHSLPLVSRMSLFREQFIGTSTQRSEPRSISVLSRGPTVFFAVISFKLRVSIWPGRLRLADVFPVPSDAIGSGADGQLAEELPIRTCAPRTLPSTLRFVLC